jgi:hypothetical protein
MSNKAKRKEIVRNFKPGGRMIFSIFQSYAPNYTENITSNDIQIIQTYFCTI